MTTSYHGHQLSYHIPFNSSPLLVFLQDKWEADKLIMVPSPPASLDRLIRSVFLDRMIALTFSNDPDTTVIMMLRTLTVDYYQ